MYSILHPVSRWHRITQTAKQSDAYECKSLNSLTIVSLTKRKVISQAVALQYAGLEALACVKILNTEKVSGLPDLPVICGRAWLGEFC